MNIRGGLAYKDKETVLEQSLQIIESVQKLELPQDGFVVVGGASLVLMGLKDQTSDLDLLVSNRALEQISKYPYSEVHETTEDPDYDGATNETVRIPAGHYGRLAIMAANEMNDSRYSINFDKISKNKQTIAGIPCADPYTMLKWKASIGRDKDHQDVGVAIERLRKTRQMSRVKLAHIGLKNILAPNPYYTADNY